jgi:uncharacterized protein YutE (UPF0331/DUF86 family)
LRDTLENLEPIRALTFDEFKASYRNYWLAERGLQLAAEAIFDIGNHVLAGHLNVYAADYKDIIRKLGERGVLSKDITARLEGLAGFRNILVHQYLDIDLAAVHANLQRIEDLDGFANEIEAYLDRVAPA